VNGLQSGAALLLRDWHLPLHLVVQRLERGLRSAQVHRKPHILRGDAARLEAGRNVHRAGRQFRPADGLPTLPRIALIGDVERLLDDGRLRTAAEILFELPLDESARRPGLPNNVVVHVGPRATGALHMLEAAAVFGWLE
jgi:hypothetical protein